jgi:hypothetical protein
MARIELVDFNEAALAASGKAATKKAGTRRSRAKKTSEPAPVKQVEETVTETVVEENPPVAVAPKPKKADVEKKAPAEKKTPAKKTAKKAE